MSQTPKILVVDDDPSYLSEVAESLEGTRCAVFPASTPQQALDIVASHPLDLVVSNQLIRPETGVCLQSLVHSVPQNANVPFLYTTTSQIPDVISRRIGDRNVFFVRKPFDRRSFATLVEFALLTPQLIQSHIQSVHQRCGLNPPHRKQDEANVFPNVDTDLLGSNPMLQQPF